MRIAHLSDLHWSAERLADKIRSDEQVRGALHRLRPDLIVVAGDSFDHAVRLEELAARAAMNSFAEMRAIAPVLAIKGNYSHDRNSVEALRSVGVIVSTEPEIVLFHDESALDRERTLEVLPMEGMLGSRNRIARAAAVFCTLPYPSSGFLAGAATLNPSDMRLAISQAITTIIRGFAAVPTGNHAPKILLFHGTIPEAKISSTQHAMGMDIELRLQDIEACGFDLVCAGHLHFAQQIGSNVFYPGGTIYHCYGDDGEKGFWMHEFSAGPMLRHAAQGEFAPGDDRHGGLKRTSHYVPVQAVRMRIVELDFSDPFFELEPWAETEACDVQVRLKLLESDRERYRMYDWKQIFPAARSITVVPTVESVASIRAEEVRQAHTLPEKLLAYGHNVGVAIASTVLDKARLLEDHDADRLMEIVSAK